MTAFASNILAGLTGLGAKAGAGTTAPMAGMTAGTAGEGAAGAFEALLAGLVANGESGGETAVVTPAVDASVQAAGPMAAAVASPLVALEAGAPVDADSVEVDGKDAATAESALAGAAALVLPAPIAPERTVDAQSAQDAVTSVPSPAIPRTFAAGPVDLAPSAAPTPAGAAGDGSAPQAGTSMTAPAATPWGAAWDRQAAVVSPAAWGMAGAEPLPAAPVEDAPTPQASPVVTARAADEAASQAARVTAPELVSLAARLVEPSRAVTIGAAPVEAPVAEGLEAPDPAAEPVEAVAIDVAAAEVPAEAVLTEPAVAAEAAPAPQPARKSARGEARAEAVRADTVEKLAPGLRSVADAAAVEAGAAEPVAAQPVAEADAPVEAPARDSAPVAQAAAPQAHAAGAANAAAVVRGSPETVARLASDIVRKLDAKNTRFDLQLDPLGLGKVDVSVEINADGRLTAALTFDSAQAAADLRGRATELRQALEKAGFDLTDASLSFDTGAQGGGFGGREAGEQSAAWSSRAFRSAQTDLEQADAQLAAAAYARTPSGGVDIRI